MTAWRHARRLIAREDGAISIMATVGLILLAGVFALSVDLGNAYVAGQQLQGAVDLAALKAVTDMTNAASLAQTTVTDNVGAENLAGPVSAVAGQYPPSGYDWSNIGTLALDARFAAGGAETNALQVSAQLHVPLFLARLFYSGNMSVSAQATAYNQPLTQVTIGTGALSVDSGQSTANNALLSSLLGSSVSLNAVSYQGLANANVNLFGFLDVLATATGTPSDDYSALLSTNVTMSEVISALVTTVAGDSSLAATAATLTAALDTLNGAIGSSGSFTLGSFMQLDDVTAARAVGAQMNLFALLRASAEAMNAVNQPTTVVSIPVTGGSVTLQTAIIEPAQMSVIGGVGIVASTAQIRIYMTINPTAPITVLGTNIALQFPVYLTSLAGQATVTGLDCNGPDAANATVTISAQAGAATAQTADIDSASLYQSLAPATEPAVIADAAGLVKVTASGSQSINGSPQTLTFTSPFDTSDTQTVSLSDPLTNITTYLVTNDSYSVTALGLPLQPTIVTSQLAPILDAIAPQADALIGDLLSAIGTSAAYMDVTVPYVRCSNPVLAQ